MRRTLILLFLVVAAAACSGTAAEPAVTTPATDPTATTRTSTSTTTTTVPADDTTTTFAPAATTTTTTVLVNAGAVCASYSRYLGADEARESAEALRNLSIAVGFPRSSDVTSSLDVLRGRSAERSEAAARTVLDTEFGEPCAGVASSQDEGALVSGILVGGPDGVNLLDGTPVITSDPVGTYFAAFDDSRGGVFSLLEIRGLEIIDHRSGTRAFPRDLLLAEDASLHDAARIDGVDTAVVTTWEAEGEFADLFQFLYLAPFDRADPIPIGKIGDLFSAVETVSYAAGTYLVTESQLGGSASIYALDGSGARIDGLPGLPIVVESEYDDERQSLQFARFAPDGSSFAYLRVRRSTGAGAAGELRTEVVLQRMSDGVELLSVEIGEPADLFTSLDYDGRHVIVAARTSLAVVDTRGEEGPELLVLPLVNAGFAYFLESGISYAGDG